MSVANLSAIKSIVDQIGVVTIDHITHINNLASILTKGLLAHGNQYQQCDISNKTVNARRAGLDPIYHQPIHRYIPFYYNARNAMLYATESKFGDNIIILGYNPLLLKNALLTNGNAACKNTKFSNNINDLSSVNWSKVFSLGWYGDRELMRTMMAEALVPHTVHKNMLEIIYCRSPRVKQYILENYNIQGVEVVVDSQQFFNLKQKEVA